MVPKLFMGTPWGIAPLLRVRLRPVAKAKTNGIEPVTEPGTPIIGSVRFWSDTVMMICPDSITQSPRNLDRAPPGSPVRPYRSPSGRSASK